MLSGKADNIKYGKSVSVRQQGVFLALKVFKLKKKHTNNKVHAFKPAVHYITKEDSTSPFQQAKQRL